eukprot:755280-Hanusia_phi.AAC.2
MASCECDGSGLSAVDERENHLMSPEYFENYASPGTRSGYYGNFEQYNPQNNIYARLSRVRHESTFRSDIDNVLGRSSHALIADDLVGMNAREANSFPSHRYGGGYGYGSGFSAPAIPPPDSSDDAETMPFEEDEDYELDNEGSVGSMDAQDGSSRSSENVRGRDGAGSLDFPVIMSGRSIDNHVLRHSPDLLEEFSRGIRNSPLPSRAFEAAPVSTPNLTATNTDSLDSFSGNQDAVTITLQTVASGQVVQVSTTLRGEELGICSLHSISPCDFFFLAKRVARRTCDILRDYGIAVNSERIDSNDTLALSEPNAQEIVLSEFEERTALRLAERVRSSLQWRYDSLMAAEARDVLSEENNYRRRVTAIKNDDKIWRGDRGHSMQRSLSPNKDVGSMFRKKTEPLLTWQDRHDYSAVKFGMPHRFY